MKKKPFAAVAVFVWKGKQYLPLSVPACTVAGHQWIKATDAISQCYWPQKEAVSSPFLHRWLSDAEDDFQLRNQRFLTKKSDHHHSHRLQSGPGIYNMYRYSF